MLPREGDGLTRRERAVPAPRHLSCPLSGRARYPSALAARSPCDSSRTRTVRAGTSHPPRVTRPAPSQEEWDQSGIRARATTAGRLLCQSVFRKRRRCVCLRIEAEPLGDPRDGAAGFGQRVAPRTLFDFDGSANDPEESEIEHVRGRSVRVDRTRLNGVPTSPFCSGFFLPDGFRSPRSTEEYQKERAEEGRRASWRGPLQSFLPMFVLVRTSCSSAVLVRRVRIGPSSACPREWPGTYVEETGVLLQNWACTRGVGAQPRVLLLRS